MSKMVVSEGLAFFPKEIQYIRVVPSGVHRWSIQVGFKNRDMVHYVTSVDKEMADEMFTSLISVIEKASMIAPLPTPPPTADGYIAPPDGIEMQSY